MLHDQLPRTTRCQGLALCPRLHNQLPGLPDAKDWRHAQGWRMQPPLDTRPVARLWCCTSSLRQLERAAQHTQQVALCGGRLRRQGLTPALPQAPHHPQSRHGGAVASIWGPRAATKPLPAQPSPQAKRSPAGEVQRVLESWGGRGLWASLSFAPMPSSSHGRRLQSSEGPSQDAGPTCNGKAGPRA